jgi:hypothetical protein
VNRNPEVDRWFDEQDHPLVGVTFSASSTHTPSATTRARPHRGLDLEPPEPGFDPGKVLYRKIQRLDVLGGLIHEYERAAV